LNGIVDEISKRKEGTIDISRVGPRRESAIRLPTLRSEDLDG
jgi:hypothetical protein